MSSDRLRLVTLRSELRPLAKVRIETAYIPVWLMSQMGSEADIDASLLRGVEHLVCRAARFWLSFNRAILPCLI
jgi:hypothetical protein